MENIKQKSSFTQKLLLGNLLNTSQAFYLYNGIIMILLWALMDIFSNIYSTWLIGFTTPIFVICAFVYLFLKNAIKRNIPIIQLANKKESSKESSSDENDKKENIEPAEDTNNKMVTFDASRIDRIFIVIKYLSIIYIVTNIVSASLTTTFSFFHEKEPFYVKPSDVNMAEYFLKNQNLSRKATIDSVNAHLPKPLFSSPGIVQSFKLDTLGNYEYNIVYSNPKTQKTVSLNLSSLKCYVANFTDCDVKAFCSCFQGNRCLSTRQFDLFRFLILSKDTIRDTLYMVRVKN